MSDRGFIAVDRGLFDHPTFAAEPFTEREAWIWMIAEAAWKPCRVRVGRATIELARGQLAYATRFLAGKWRWSEARVRRFLSRLTADALIDAQATREATQITICNYEKYQELRRTDEAAPDAPMDVKPTQRRTSNQSSSLRSEDTQVQRDHATGFDRFWSAYPAKVGKDAARKSFDKAIASGVTLDAMLAAIDRYRRCKPPDRDWCHPTTWLNQGRWNDELPDPQDIFADRGSSRPRQRPGPGSREPTGHNALAALLDTVPADDPDQWRGQMVDHRGSERW